MARLCLFLVGFALLTADVTLSQINHHPLGDLLQTVSEEGTVPVIVELNVPFRVENTLHSESLVAAQRSQIHRAQQEVLESVASRSISNVKIYETVPYVALTVDEDALFLLAGHPEVRAIHEDMLHRPHLLASTVIIGAPAAWSAGYTGAGQTVAVLDTGTDITHPFLQGRIVAEACFSTPGGGGLSLCPNGLSSQIGPGSSVPSTNCGGISGSGCNHGTHVAGIALGYTSTLSGVAPEADLISVQVNHRSNNCSPDSSPCLRVFASDVILGLEYVYSLRNDFSIASVNMSFGGGQFSGYCDHDTRKPAIDNLRGVGIATIVASGNNLFTDAINAPACISTAISVGSTDAGSFGTTQDEVSWFSNSADILDMLAPGIYINSSVIGGGYQNYAGTSMAAPHVTGAWAVLRQANPSATVTEILNAVTSTGIPITDTRNGLVRPRLQLDAALTELVDIDPPIASVNPNSLLFILPPDQTDSQFATLSNLAGVDALDLVYSVNATPPITISPTNGTVAGNSSIQLEVTANSEGVNPGTYEYVAQITTNDPDNPMLTVDVTLIVADIEDYDLPITAAGGAGWWMLSSPLSGSTVQNLASANVVHGIPGEYPNTPTANLFTGYDGFNDPETYERGFVLPTGLSQPLVPGKGFIWYMYHDQYPTGYQPPSAAGSGTSTHQQLPFNIPFTGISPVFETHQTTFTADERTNETDDGWYLIGNPYQMTYNVRGITPTTGGFSGTFQHWDAAENAYVPLNRFDDDEADIGAGFFMQFVHQPTLPATITFGPAGGGPPPPPSDMVEYFTARFELTGELLVAYGGNHIPVEVSDRHTRVIFSEEATDDFDMLDAGKLTPLSYYWANIAMMGMQGDETVRRSIESRSLLQGAVTIPMALSTYANGLDAAGTFTITLAENLLGEGWQVLLYDLETGETVNMLADNYTFSIEVQSAIDADERFEITFTPPSVSGEGSGEALIFSLEAIWPNPTTRTAHVRFALETAGEIRLDVFDVLGRRVAQVANGEYAAGSHVLPLNTSDLASGVYVVRLTAGSNVAVQRVTVAR